MSTRQHPQRRNRYSFIVTWPAVPAADCPADLRDIATRNAGKSYRCYFPTLDAADLTARGLEMAGAAIGSIDGGIGS